MKHAAVALDYEQRIASLEAAMLTLVDMMREQQVKLDAMHGLAMKALKEEARLAAMRRYGQGYRERKSFAGTEAYATNEAAAEGACNTRDGLTEDAVIGGQAHDGC